MEYKPKSVSVALENGARMLIQVKDTEGDEDIAARVFEFSEVTKTIQGIGASMAECFRNARVEKAAVEFGLEACIEAGKLTAVLIGGSTTASFKVTLEWSISGASDRS